MELVQRSCPCGDLQGQILKGCEHYMGIPFAKADRWEDPVEVTSWEGMLDATEKGDCCYQPGTFGEPANPVRAFYGSETNIKQTFTYSEDCLNLNIRTPSDAKNAPVLVYIHGGGYLTGRGSAWAFDGSNYCKKGIVTVTIQYRVNIFANAFGDGHTGNYNLKDQVCALRWIKNNIAAFGGDPDNVTIMGESAGAMSVQNLIYTPYAKGLFKGAIMLSGGGIFTFAYGIQDTVNVTDFWIKIKERFGAKTIDDLKSLTPKELSYAWRDTCALAPRFANTARPVVDGDWIPAMPEKLVEDGNINKVPTIISFLSEDMWPLSLYKMAVQWSQLAPNPVYGMFFDRRIPGTDLPAFHALDVRYVFGTFDVFKYQFEETDYRISQNIIDYFTNFARTGNPNGEGLPTWEVMKGEVPQFMHFGDDPCAMYTVPTEPLEAFQKLGKPFPGMK